MPLQDQRQPERTLEPANASTFLLRRRTHHLDPWHFENLDLFLTPSHFVFNRLEVCPLDFMGLFPKLVSGIACRRAFSNQQ